MLEKRRYCIVCCGDLEKQRKGRIHYPYKYNLLGLVEVFCKYFQCDFNSLLGTSDVDFSRDQFPFCLDCKLIMVHMFGLEESINRIIQNIEELVRKLSARCLSCKRKNCSSCKSKKKKRTGGKLTQSQATAAIPERSEGLQEVNIEVDEPSISHDATTSADMKADPLSFETKPHLRSLLEPKLCPKVVVEKQELQDLAKSAGLTIFEPPVVAPNVFKSLKTVFEEDAHRAAEVAQSQPQELNFQQFDYTIANSGTENEGVYLYETIEVTIPEGEELMQTVCLDVVEEVVNADHIDLGRYVINGVPVFEMRDGMLKCALCETDRDVYLTELFDHYKFHGGQDDSLGATAAAAIQGIQTGHIVSMSNPAAPMQPLHLAGTMDLTPAHHSQDQIVLRTMSDGSQTITLGVDPNNITYAGNIHAGEDLHEDQVEAIHAVQFQEQLQTEPQSEIMDKFTPEENDSELYIPADEQECTPEIVGTSTVPESVDQSADDTAENNEATSIRKSARRQAKKRQDETILAKETASAFSNLFQFLEVIDMDRNLLRLSVLPVEDNVLLLENQWTFEFKEGEGYKCRACDFQSTTPEEFINHCRGIHPNVSWERSKLHTKLCKQIVMLRKRIKNLVENATDESWRESYPDVFKKAVVSTALFDLKTRPIEPNVFVFDNFIKFHTDDTFFHCDACGYKEKWKSVFIHHLYEAHASDDVPGKDLQIDAAVMEEVSPNKFVYRGFTVEKIEDKFFCGSCNYSNTDLNVVRRHLYSTHYAKTKLTCDKCEALFTTKLKLAIHKKTHENEDPSSIGKVAKKEKMVEIEPGRLIYRGYYVTIIGEDAYRCEECNAVMNTKSKMQTHLYGSHFMKGRPQKPKTCDTCGKVFFNARNFYTHKLNHMSRINPGQYICENCGRVFRSSECLRRHKRKYREKNVECKVCGKMFLWQSKLEAHMVKHSDVKRYECLECNKSYKNPESLLQHKRTHGGKKPYVCDICDMRFTQSYSVVKHKLAIHQESKNSSSVQVSA